MLLPLSPQVFSLMATLVEEHAGLFYAPADAELFANKLSDRASELGFDALLDYYYFLRYDPGGEAERDRLVEALVVHETYFFREESSLRALIDHYIAPRATARGRVRLWCAACATGEEPITLAVLLAQRNLLDRVEIMATDISERALERARAGQYGKRAMRAVDGSHASVAHLLRADGDRVIVQPSLVARIDWRQVNLVDQTTVTALGHFDVIVCRNVLIYFRDDMVRRVVSTLVDALEPEGVLQVGVSESLMRFGSALNCKEVGGAFFYERAS